MTNWPIVSIIIPTYNSAPYIISCLESVVNQTYKGGMECLIVDDCGKDNCIQIVEEFVSSYKGCIRFQIVHRDKNGGASAARNSGIRAATGDYIFFLDPDDRIIPECIDCLVCCIQKHPDAECVFAGAKATNGYEWMSIMNKHLPDYSNNPDWISAAMACRYILNMTLWNRLISRTFIVENNLFFIEGVVHEDELWSQDLALHLHSIAICRYDTYIYQVRVDGLMANESKDVKMFEKRMKDWFFMLDRLPHNAHPALLGCLFFTQNHWDLSLEQKKLHTTYLKKIANHSHSIACAAMKMYLLMPEFLQKKSLVKRVFFRFFEPYSIYSRLSPIV